MKEINKLKAGVYILLGGNLGDREANLHAACEKLISHGVEIIRLSALYETAAWGKEDQPSFLNQVVEVKTSYSARELLTHLLEIESEIGRLREGERWGPRLIDMDLLFYGDSIENEEGITVPHPRLHLRQFTLVPMNELAPQFVHPVFHKTIQTLLQECTDTLEVKKVG